MHTITCKKTQHTKAILHQLGQDPGEDVDSLVLWLRKQVRHCGYGVEEVEFALRDQLLEKVSSQELWTKLFEVPNIQLAAALTTARAWEKSMPSGNCRRRGKEQSEFGAGQSRPRKAKWARHAQVLHGCGRSGQLHVTRCVLRKESCVLSVAREGTGQRVAAMGQMEKGNCVSDGRASGSNDWRSCGAISRRNFKKRGQQVNQVDYDSEEEPLALPINYNEERASEDNNNAAKINGLRSLLRSSFTS